MARRTQERCGSTPRRRIWSTRTTGKDARVGEAGAGGSLGRLEPGGEGGELAVARRAVQGAEEVHSADCVGGDGLSDVFSGFVALGLRMAKEVGDVRTANLPARGCSARSLSCVTADSHE